MSRFSVNTGYSLIEVMLTLVVVGVGILAIVQLQSSISGQVGDNKAKAEATALAEARIEYLRNYIDETEFGTKLLATSPSGSYRNVPTKAEDPVNGFYDADGVNATFTMKEAIETTSSTDEIREVSVKVSWQDRTGSSQEITVTSEINYVPPVAYGQKALNYKLPVDFNLPSGAALPGEGTLSDLGLSATATSNDDGTSEAVDSKNRYLAVGDDIVLILPQKDTCDSGGTDCNEFTRIHGRVYISTRKNNRPTIHEVNVIASNTAYCTRYYLDGTLNIVGTNTAANAPLTKDIGSYEYFDYTCYVGPGWYGNIGVYRAGGNKQDDKVCMGEPYSTEPNLSIALSYFRTYRGILYRLGNTDSYWSIGVKGGLDLGLDTTGEPKHNFVIGSFAPELDDDQDCINSGLVVRDDAINNDLFKNVPTDFVCLNPEVYSYDDTVFGMVSSCTAGETYDPTL